MTDYKPIVSANFRRLRKESGIEQKFVADTLGVTAHTIGNWESGIRIPRADHLYMASEIFHCSLAEFFLPVVSTESRDQ